MIFKNSVSASASILILALLGTACGGTDVDSSGAGRGGSDGATGGNGGSGGAATGGNGSSGSVSLSTCLADSNEPSSSSTVEWSDGEVAEGLTLTLGLSDDKLTPDTLTVPVNVRFHIENPAGGKLRSIKVGCATGQTVSAKIKAGFIIHAPGAYDIIDEKANNFDGAKLGTVTVE